MHVLFAPPLLLLMTLFPVTHLAIPRLTRPDIFFSFTVDPALRQSADGRSILRQFSRTVIFSSLIGLALALTGVFAGLSAPMALMLMISGAVIEAAGLIAAFATARRRVRPHRVEPSREREVILRPRPVRPPGGWVGQAGPFVVLGIAAFLLWWKWDSIPERFPIHWDIHGRPNGWAIKSWRSVFGSLFIGAMTCMLLSLLMNGMARGVRRIHAGGPDGEKESRFLKTMLVMILGVEYCMATTFGFSPLLPPALMAVLVMASLLLGIAAIVVALRSGQGGWRLQGQNPASAVNGPQAPAGDRTPDECWKWGLIYHNPADPAVWVEKRFGIGWTLNFGNSRAWLILCAILAFAVAVPVLSILLMRK